MSCTLHVSWSYPANGLAIPKGLWLIAQGWRTAPTLGKLRLVFFNPKGVVAGPPPTNQLAATPLGLMPARQTLPRVALWAQPWATGRNPKT